MLKLLKQRDGWGGLGEEMSSTGNDPRLFRILKTLKDTHMGSTSMCFWENIP